MAAVSVTIETIGLTWASWHRLVTEIEQLGFAGIFRSDHLTAPVPLDSSTLDMVVALTDLAHQTQRVHFGPLVAPLSFRNPVLLAHQAAALDGLSQGRMILGLGAGWNEREHDMFGFTLGDIPTRMARLEEALDIITQLFQSQEPVTYTGRFYRLHDARLFISLYQPHGPPILIGGSGPKRTLPLVARYATIWNGSGLTPEAYVERSAVLDVLLREAGRQPAEVKRTVLLLTVCGRDSTDFEQRVSWLRQYPPVAHASLDDLLTFLRTQFQAFIGTPDELVRHIRAYIAGGAEEVMLQWYGLDDIAGLQLIAEEVLPHLTR